MPPAIRVTHLSKAYQLGNFGTGTISRDLERFIARVRGKEDPFLKIGEVNDRTVKGKGDVVWSLRDFNFDIEQGSAVGIIGRNGAGKSTLLKTLSRVTSPTTGSIKVKGRIASLLEVGTGFHPELTGRENVYLNGAILGMRKAEIKRKFDEIVAFSGVERYIDTPVKRYSSGMYVRLAFAVAAHLEAEILIVDEVLAVGDAEFQKKCLGKMNDVSKGEGRTILFVSHNMAAINQLCNQAISLVNGQLYNMGPTSMVVDDYLKLDSKSDAYVKLDDTIKRFGNGKVRFSEVYLKKEASERCNRVYSIGEAVRIGFSISSNLSTRQKVRTSVELKTIDGIRLANMIDEDSKFQVVMDAGETITYEMVLEDIRLYPGTYYLNLYAGDMSSTDIYDYVEECISFEIIDGGQLTSRPLPKSAGLLFYTPEWKVVNNELLAK